MPTLRFPPPVGDADFDWLVCQIAERKYGASTATRYGRNGQAQHGVDITLLDAQDRLVAIQSKHTEKLTAQMMDEEIDKLLGRSPAGASFPHRVDEFIFATSALRDTKQTDHALALTKANSFRVTVWAWETLNELLNTMPTLAGMYCEAILGAVPLEETRLRHAQFLRQALDRPALLDGFRYEGSFEDQRVALRGIVGFVNTGNIYDRHHTLVSSALPYTEDDDYGRSLKRLKNALEALIRHIEKNMRVLESFAPLPRGRLDDRADRTRTKTYIDYEDKRELVIDQANRILEDFGLPRL